MIKYVYQYGCTGPTCNSCTKCVGSPGIIHDCSPDCNPNFLGINACITSQLNVALIQLRGLLMCLT